MKIRLLLLFVFSLAIAGFAQSSSGTIKLGYYAPGATDGGFVVGYNWNKYIDENFDLGFGIDWFRKVYTDQSYIKELESFAGPMGTENELRAKTNLHDFPMQANLRVSFPLDHNLRLFFDGGLGLDFLFVYYRSYQNPQDDNLKVAVDFGWRLGAGIAYPLGRRSEVNASIDYHNSQPSWDYEVTDNTKTPPKTKVFTRVFDMSGVMARIGFKFFY